MTESANQRELLYCWCGQGFNVLVPKLRGTGFLKVPYAHHHNPKIDAIAEAGNCDVFGLDGSLDFQYWTLDAGERAAFAAAVVPMLEAHYKAPAREVLTGEYWAHHPGIPEMS